MIKMRVAEIKIALANMDNIRKGALEGKKIDETTAVTLDSIYLDLTSKLFSKDENACINIPSNDESRKLSSHNERLEKKESKNHESNDENEENEENASIAEQFATYRDLLSKDLFDIGPLSSRHEEIFHHILTLTPDNEEVYQENLTQVIRDKFNTTGINVHDQTFLIKASEALLYVISPTFATSNIKTQADEVKAVQASLNSNLLTESVVEDKKIESKTIVALGSNPPNPDKTNVLTVTPTISFISIPENKSQEPTSETKTLPSRQKVKRISENILLPFLNSIGNEPIASGEAKSMLDLAITRYEKLEKFGLSEQSPDNLKKFKNLIGKIFELYVTPEILHGIIRKDSHILIDNDDAAKLGRGLIGLSRLKDGEFLVAQIRELINKIDTIQRLCAEDKTINWLSTIRLQNSDVGNIRVHRRRIAKILMIPMLKDLNQYHIDMQPTNESDPSQNELKNRFSHHSTRYKEKYIYEAQEGRDEEVYQLNKDASLSFIQEIQSLIEASLCSEINLNENDSEILRFKMNHILAPVKALDSLHNLIKGGLTEILSPEKMDALTQDTSTKFKSMYPAEYMKSSRLERNLKLIGIFAATFLAAAAIIIIASICPVFTLPVIFAAAKYATPIGLAIATSVASYVKAYRPDNYYLVETKPCKNIHGFFGKAKDKNLRNNQNGSFVQHRNNLLHDPKEVAIDMVGNTLGILAGGVKTAQLKMDP